MTHNNTNIQLHEAWHAFMTDVNRRLGSQHDFNMWFEPLVPVSFTGNVLTVRVPSAFYYERLEKDYIDILRESLKSSFGGGVGLNYQILTDATNNLCQNAHSSKDSYAPAISQAQRVQKNTFRSNLNEKMRLDNFYHSICNRMVYTAARSIIESPGNNPFNPLFIHGASGVGKTHILHAIGNELVRLNPSLRAVYVPAQIFKMQYVEAAVRRKKPEEFVHYYQNIDLLLIDDIQELHDAVSTQNAFFQIFNNLKMLGKQIVITSDRPPVDLKGLEDRLYTRMKWGLTAELERPDAGLRKQILEAKMYECDVNLPEDVFKFIVKHADNNVRDIEGTLTSLMAHSIFSKKPIDINLARKVMAQTVGIEERSLSVSDVIKTVCSYYDIAMDDVKGRSRKREIVLARQICMYISKEHTDASLVAIGRELGRRDHTTVLYATRTVKDIMDTSNVVRQQVIDICQLLNL
ncbi:chromosomal replication initiator protein DnaA [Porphyromonas sp.]|uniref:chromosomal replication initiator protein DnaA n=1 Tax=Porphyromonas sp. TaxID=1924944 RepID=UPI0026DC687F|nr:chromosomal replication initiator protein DnaA [Porphyromonas sp.]MDO4695377.1 chromosomal replication initiator protein DnaA [Porphyromonas sp.]MDO4770496.1 chromosomal replication initiator protein DnaA [Porphyromonas sp.]